MLNPPPTCYSGGADGSDLAWGAEASARGHEVIHFSFEGHRTRAPRAQLVALSAEQLATADEALARANKTLKRKNPLINEEPRRSLLRRNWFQVREAQALYAVAQGLKDDGTVAGGTGWTVQMFRDLFTNVSPLPLLVYDQSRRTWLHALERGWIELGHVPTSPESYDNFAGVGTRRLNHDGYAAIRSVWRPKLEKTE